MKRYLICTDHGTERSAASKARQDAEKILLECGCEPVLFKGEHTSAGNAARRIRLVFQTVANWRRLYRTAERGSTVIMQYPLFPMKAAYFSSRLLPRVRHGKDVHFTALIHDLNSLRGMFGKAGAFSDRVFLKRFDRLICHNRKMREYLRGEGFPDEQITELGLFDYLTEAQPRERGLKDGITVAGNLDPAKSGYIRELTRLADGKYPIHLYGNNCTGDRLAQNVFYHGSFPPEELPGKLEGAFGLVWDGPSAETCEGPTGQYLRYNDPHKVSLYLASGLPVIIWDQAAAADEIRQENAGITISSVKEIAGILDSLSGEAYEAMRRNAGRMGSELRQGKRLKKAAGTEEQEKP